MRDAGIKDREILFMASPESGQGQAVCWYESETLTEALQKWFVTAAGFGDLSLEIFANRITIRSDQGVPEDWEKKAQVPIARNRSEILLLDKGLIYRTDYKLLKVNMKMTNNLIIFRPAKDLISHCTDDNQITNIYVKR